MGKDSHPFFLADATLWNRSKGSPRDMDEIARLPKDDFRERFPPGSYVFVRSPSNLLKNLSLMMSNRSSSHLNLNLSLGMSWFSKSGVADTSAPEPASRSPDCLFLVSTVSYVIDIYLKYNDSVVHLPRGWWFLRIHKSLRLCQHSTGFVWLGERPVGFSNVIAAIPLTPGRLKIPIYYSP